MQFCFKIAVEEIQPYAKSAGKMTMKTGLVVTDVDNSSTLAVFGIDFANALPKIFYC